MQAADWERRLARLEAVESIRALKHRYLACCDAKDPAGVRACFADGPVDIDYGAIGQFDRADAMVAVYTEMACHPHMVEMHLGTNPRIELEADGLARGHWSLYYQLINTQEQTLTQLGGEYTDRYCQQDGRWKIQATRFAVTSTLLLSLGSDAVAALVRGRP